MVCVCVYVCVKTGVKVNDNSERTRPTDERRATLRIYDEKMGESREERRGRKKANLVDGYDRVSEVTLLTYGVSGSTLELKPVASQQRYRYDKRLVRLTLVRISRAVNPSCKLCGLRWVYRVSLGKGGLR